MYVIVYVCFCLYVVLTIITGQAYGAIVLSSEMVLFMILGGIIIGAIQEVLNKLDKLIDN